MKIYTQMMLMLLISVVAHAEAKVAIKANSGRFEITQEHKDDFIERIKFTNPEKATIQLAGFSWAGHYSISPDEKWIFRTQKVGSGASIAILYKVEENGRVSEVVHFNEALWEVAVKYNHYKNEELYHKAIRKASWSEGGKLLELTLSGTNTKKTDDHLKIDLTYNLQTNSVSVVE